MKDIRLPLKRIFKKLIEKVRKVFCGIVRSLEDIDEKEIVKAVLIGLIPAFGAGVPALLVPIIIGIIIYFLKKGINEVCPIPTNG
jgi:hypothetical protein